MSKKLFFGLLILIMVSISVGVGAAQDGALPRNETLYVAGMQWSTFQTFNPLNPNPTWPAIGENAYTFEPLFVFNVATGNLDPLLGKELTFTDDTTAVVTLHDGTHWQDGEPLTVDDVVFTFEIARENSVRNYATFWDYVDSVTATGDRTIEFKLNADQLNAGLLKRWLSNAHILPEHIWAGQDPFTFTFYDEEQGWPIGTGPYTLTIAEPERMVWDRDDNWWGAEAGFMELPEPLRLVWIITGTEENRAQLMSNNQLDSVMNLTLGAFEAIQARNPNVEAWYSELPYAWADPCPRQLSFNMEAAPWDSVNMRQAISSIIDRQQIIDIAYEGTSTPSSTMFVQYGGMDPFINAVNDAGMGFSPTADVAAGQALIEGEGYVLNGSGLYEKDGEVLAADIIVNNSSIEYTRTVDVLVEQFRAAGIDAVSRPVTGATHGDLYQNGDFQLSYDWDSCGSVNEPWNSMNQYTTHFYAPIGERVPGGNNQSRWNTEGTAAYTEIIDVVGTLPLGDPTIPDMVVEAYRYFYDELPFVPLVQASKLVPFDTTYWSGWPTQENNYNHPATWWYSTHQIIHNLTKTGS